MLLVLNDLDFVFCFVICFVICCVCVCVWKGDVANLCVVFFFVL